MNSTTLIQPDRNYSTSYVNYDYFVYVINHALNNKDNNNYSTAQWKIPKYNHVYKNINDELFGEMRNMTNEENEWREKVLDILSEKIDFNIYDFL